MPGAAGSRPIALDRPIAQVVVAGGGIVGWSAAAALKRRLPWLDVTLLAIEPPADALADRIASTLPSIFGFHDDLGLGDDDTVVRAGSLYRLGTRFRGWATGSRDYVHAYGGHGNNIGAASFHHHWVRAAHAGTAAPFDRHSVAAMLAANDRFVPPAEIDKLPGTGLDYGLQIDPPRYRGMLRAFALHCGVRERPGDIAAVTMRDDGFVASLRLDDGTDLAADLFVDCTGPAARIRSCVDEERQSWRAWLPCDRMLIAEVAAPTSCASTDTVEAVPCGWRWAAGGRHRTSIGLVYSSAHADDADAAALLGAPQPARVAIDAGTRPAPWLRNCVAIGDAATAIEPLEWTNLHLAHSAIDRMIAMLPDRACAGVETGDFNRQCAAEAMRVRDFVILHYAVSSRIEPFWRAVAAIEPPPSLAHSLAQFRERGRLPIYEEETFARDSWLAVLLGQGVLPRRSDPLIDIVPPQQSDALMASVRETIATAVAQAPTQAAFLQAMNRQIAR
ncbi:tryptophan 7-halogenase [Sphingomonas sp. Tas61C01]|uniref:tryptophan 7-halogenase n=1 Tax=Sphingomonas sp. Tas61C01 TaxID=3458297 RepID=UPI00403E9AB5